MAQHLAQHNHLAGISRQVLQAGLQRLAQLRIAQGTLRVHPGRPRQDQLDGAWPGSGLQHAFPFAVRGQGSQGNLAR